MNTPSIDGGSFASVDSSGNVYWVGEVGGMPIGAWGGSADGNSLTHWIDIFVRKFNPEGELIGSAIIGGERDDWNRVGVSGPPDHPKDLVISNDGFMTLVGHSNAQYSDIHDPKFAIQISNIPFDPTCNITPTVSSQVGDTATVIINDTSVTPAISFNNVHQGLVDNSGGRIDSSLIVAGSNITINNNNSFTLIDNSTSYTINVIGSLAIGNNNNVGNQKNVSFRVVGTNSADTIKGTLGQAVNEFLDGGAGDDRLLVYEGADVVAGGEGNDFLHGNFGGDLVDGGAGNDTLREGHGHNEILGGSGGDWIWGGIGGNTVDAGDSDNAKDQIFVSVDSVQNQFGNPNGENFDLIKNVGLEDEIFLHSREDVGLTYGLTHMNGQQTRRWHLCR